MARIMCKEWQSDNHDHSVSVWKITDETGDAVGFQIEWDYRKGADIVTGNKSRAAVEESFEYYVDLVTNEYKSAGQIVRNYE